MLRVKTRKVEREGTVGRSAGHLGMHARAAAEAPWAALTLQHRGIGSVRRVGSSHLESENTIQKALEAKHKQANTCRWVHNHRQLAQCPCVGTAEKITLSKPISKERAR
jgi:hypothetical protein